MVDLVVLLMVLLNYVKELSVKFVTNTNVEKINVENNLIINLSLLIMEHMNSIK